MSVIELTFEDIISNIRTRCTEYDRFRFFIVEPLRGWRSLWIGWPYTDVHYTEDVFARTEGIVRYVFKS